MTINPPPMSAEVVRRYLCFGEKSFRAACGAIRSTKPITPAKDTAVLVSMAVSIKSSHLMPFTFTPMLMAD